MLPESDFLCGRWVPRTGYNRRGFQAMLAEIERGKPTGLINFIFPKYGALYIAIHDHFYTIGPNSTDNDGVGIKNWFNKFLSRIPARKSGQW